ncbi:MAG: acetate--CoA ligase [Fusobacteria bacterium]|nr:acetate--CoA ligase [Fusobacteriota bacterium]
MSKLFYPKDYKFKDPKIRNQKELQDLYDRFANDFEGTWDQFAKEKISWLKPYDKVLDDSNKPFYRWFTNGKLNVAHQCVDRHLEENKNKVAIIFEGDDGKSDVITYRKLGQKVNRTANLLTNEFKIQKGDRVIIYMPMIPEAIYMMLACAKIGAIHSIVFGGFSAEALRDRISSAAAKLVVTADGAFRKGKSYMLKPIVDKALEIGCECVKKVCVVKRNFEEIVIGDKDVIYNDLIDLQSPKANSPLHDSEDPLFLLYTSGSTGKPKGIQHSMGGYMLWAHLTMEWVFDLKPTDTYWCTADIGWITGHTYAVYGPLSVGATTVIFEGVPTYPDAGRVWKMVEEYSINQLYTAPTLIRTLRQHGPTEPEKYDLTSLRVLGTVGEPIDEETWLWYYNEVGSGNCSVVDTWWQTETGGHMISPLPAATPMVPGSATKHLPGIWAEILDENGKMVTKVGEKGLLCITRPWPSMARNIWGDTDRFVESYFNKNDFAGNMIYFTGDGAFYDEYHNIVITGRVDDVINVSGHRLGTAEIEDSVNKHFYVGECAVVGKPDKIKGEAVFAFIRLTEPCDEKLILKEINIILKREIGSIALVDSLLVVDNLPKTRSGKIMRRILRDIAKKEEVKGDLSTIEDPSVVAYIQEKFKEKY